MPSLLLDQEEKQTPSLLQLETSGKNDSVTRELEESIETAVSDLPLGKALHLLLHVHSHVLDKAFETIRSSDPAHLLIAKADSPTVRAILSIQHYILHNGINASFHHVYGPLKEKILKRGNQQNESSMRLVSYLALYSEETAAAVQACLRAELEPNLSDKRSQLACVLVLQFLSTHCFYQQSTKQYVSFAMSVVPPLLDIADKQDRPTLLTCSAAEVAIQLVSYAMKPLPTISKDNKLLTSKIEIVEEVISDLNFNNSICQALHKIIVLLAKWHHAPGEAELTAYEELRSVLKSGTINYDFWLFILTYLTPKAVISERPISSKKQRKILSHSNTSASKLILLTLLQKTEWKSLFPSSNCTSSKLLSTEQQEVKDLVQSEYKEALSTQSLPMLLPVLVSTWPGLFPYDLVQDTQLIQAIVDRADKISDISFLIPMILRSPESSICNALMNIVKPDEDSRAEFSYELLKALVEHNADQVMPILEPNLLSLIKVSNKACELLIHCMSFMKLPLLIHKLMKMAVVSKENEKEKMTCIALISKALLHETWHHDSILYYIDMLRLVQTRQNITEPTYLTPQSPKDITLDHKSTQDTQFSDQQETTQLIKSVLIMPVQLWSSRIDPISFKLCLKQLVHYSYGIPKDIICVEAWINLRFALMQHPEAVWIVIEQCVVIMKQQPILTDDLIKNTSDQARYLKENILFLRLNPLLILQTIPQQAYQEVCLPKSYIDIKPSVRSKSNQIKTTTIITPRTQLAIELADELLYRSCEPSELGQDLHNPIEFAAALFDTIFSIVTPTPKDCPQ
ncbi:hypothetical protein EDC96DRAFT_519232 [Choanephora cucurbitarum]|nr:hypothetical protein EDC96DRAFT_519232 [Choanephora cucurbitarum]